MKNRTSIRAKKAGLSTVDLAMVREAARKEAEKHHDEILDQSFLYMLAIPLNVLVSDYWGDKAKDIGVADTHLYKQAGNGIITNCCELLAEHLYKAQYDNDYICFDENFQKPQAE